MLRKGHTLIVGCFQFPNTVGADYNRAPESLSATIVRTFPLQLSLVGSQKCWQIFAPNCPLLGRQSMDFRYPWHSMALGNTQWPITYMTYMYHILLSYALIILLHPASYYIIFGSPLLVGFWSSRMLRLSSPCFLLTADLWILVISWRQNWNCSAKWRQWSEWFANWWAVFVPQKSIQHFITCLDIEEKTCFELRCFIGCWRMLQEVLLGPKGNKKHWPAATSLWMCWKGFSSAMSCRNLMQIWPCLDGGNGGLTILMYYPVVF